MVLNRKVEHDPFTRQEKRIDKIFKLVTFGFKTFFIFGLLLNLIGLLIFLWVIIRYI